MKLVLGSDHAGYRLKEHIKTVLESLNVEFEDVGTSSKKSTDYPDYALRVARAVSHNKRTKGILICGTGIGMSITANKLPRVRAALCHNIETARLSRSHNDANILILGGRTTGQKTASEMIRVWLATAYEGGRHKRRLDKISQIEKSIRNK